MFARAIRDPCPVFHDPAAARAHGLAGIPAPLTFVQASAQFDPDYPLRPRPDDPWFGSGADPGFADPRAAGILHAEQHFEYHRPLVVGDVLTWQVRDGGTWTKQSRTGKTLEFREFTTEFRDANGGLVVTARSVRVHTDNKQATR
jgi:hypothetical protein